MARQKSSQAQNKNLPAHETKHLPTLEYKFIDSTFRLTQRDDGSSNGTALWMGGQVLSAWLAEHCRKQRRPRKLARRPRVIELGSGIGLTALAMCSLGWDVFATDLPAVVDSVLLQNIATNLPNLPAGSGTIEVRILDWNVPPEEWIWQDDRVIASETRKPSECNTRSSAGTAQPAPVFDLIVSADTVYSPSLVAPWLRTLDHLSRPTSADEASDTQQPSIFICLERRDPIVIGRLLDEAQKSYTVEQVHERTMLQAMQKHGLTWVKDDWDGLEIWSFRKRRAESEACIS